MQPQRIAIVGGGLAGATAAVSLREREFNVQIQIVCAQPHLPYNLPPLSKGYLRGEERFADQFVKPAEFYAEQRIDVMVGARATAIDSVRKTLALDHGGPL